MVNYLTSNNCDEKPTLSIKMNGFTHPLISLKKIKIKTKFIGKLKPQIKFDMNNEWEWDNSLKQ